MPFPGSPFLAYQNNQLCLDSVALSELAHNYGSPLFVYSQNAILHALSDYQKGFAGRKSLICYAVKANSNLAILQTLAKAGCGFDTVSGGEIARALRAGAKPEHIIFSGVGKTHTEIQFALQTGIGCFNVESIAELHTINAIAIELQRQAPISIRINPDVDAKTHPYISTGLTENKFGIAHQEALETYKLAATMQGISIVGIDCHIGSQITQLSPFIDAVDRMLDLVKNIHAQGITLQHLDFGGGLGIRYQEETPPNAVEMCQQILARIDAHGMQEHTIIVEPGRSLVGNAGVCVGTALYLKKQGNKNFCIVDMAMNDLPRPAMYQSYHGILPVKQSSHSTTNTTFDIVGPVCESGDWLARERILDVRAGDLLAVLSAGAYCASMASNYNTRTRAAEVLIVDGKPHLIAQRETVEQLLAREQMLS